MRSFPFLEFTAAGICWFRIGNEDCSERMTRIQITLRKQTDPETGGFDQRPRPFRRLKSAAALLVFASGAIALLLAALVLGSVIAAGVLILVVITGAVVFVKKLFALRHPQ